MLVATIFSVMLMLYILGYQVIMWLKYGEWISIPTSYLFTNNIIFPEFCDNNTNICYWINDPQSWYGVHKIITTTPLVISLFLLLIISWFIYGCFNPIIERRYTSRRTGQSLKSKREILGLTKKEFAAQLGITHDLLSHYEYGSEEIPDNTLRQANQLLWNHRRGLQFQSLRADLSLTREEFAAQLGIYHPSLVEAYERGRETIPQPVMTKAVCLLRKQKKGQPLQAIREILGLTQAQFAQRLGIHPDFILAQEIGFDPDLIIAQYERGERDVPESIMSEARRLLAQQENT